MSLALALVGACALNLSAMAQDPSAARAALNAATFDAVWATIRDTHWDPTLGGIDWLAVRTELMPLAQAAKDDEQLRAVLTVAMGRLGQSHFAIIPGELSRALPDAPETDAPATAPGAAPGAAPGTAPGTAPEAAPAASPEPGAAPTSAAAPESAKDAPKQPHPHHRRNSGSGSVGATLSILADPTDPKKFEAVITAVEPGSAAEIAGIAPGALVTAIDGESPTEFLPAGDGLERYERAVIARANAEGAPGDSTTWTLRTADGGTRDVTMTFSSDPRPVAKFGSLPPLPTELVWRHLDETERERWGAGRHEIGLIRFNIWLVPVARPFDVAMDTLRSADGIILDLRGNPGGIGGMAMGIAGHFTQESQSLGEMRTRDTALKFVTNPRSVSTKGTAVQPYAGPLAILVDDGTASTSEIFAGGLQHLGRAKVFGSRTAGAALPAVMTPLPNGDVFLHAIADYRLPDGSALEASGVKPDNARPYTRQDYLRDRDPAMAEAVRWIAAQARERSAASKANSIPTPGAAAAPDEATTPKSATTPKPATTPNPTTTPKP